MDWHCINFTRGGFHEAEAADLVLALEDAYDSAGEPPAAEVFLSRGSIGDYQFYLSPEAASVPSSACTAACARPVRAALSSTLSL